jgi:hypothetical protein
MIAGSEHTVPLTHVVFPTAMQNVDEVHDTEVSPVPGAGSNAQLDPSQCSASDASPVSLSNDPTAVQSVADVHETPASTAGAGRSAAVDVLSPKSWEPFQRAAKVRPMLHDPTTVQALDETHETPLSEADAAALSCVHLDPAQR